jgi:D-amino peptidase
MKRATKRTTVAALSLFGLATGATIMMNGDVSPRAEAQQGYTLEAPMQNREGKLRVLVYHDMEGISGQSDWHTFSYSFPDAYQKGRELLVADLNAVIDGLFAGGATDVHVVDAHGSGNPEPDIPPGKLDPRAKQVFRDKPFRQYVDLVEPNVYDAVAVVAMHAKTGSRGFASHTYTLGTDIIMNGRAITETELVAHSWARVGVPVIFASGDDRLREDLRSMPWIEFVTVKKATSASTVELRPVSDVHAEMRLAASRAVKNLSQARVMKLTTPAQAALRVVPPASLALLKGVPGVNYSEDRVDFTAPDFQAAYDGVVALIGVATRAYPQVLFEGLNKRADGQAIRLQYTEDLFNRWFDYESGRWTPPRPAAPPAGKKYHGAN